MPASDPVSIEIVAIKREDSPRVLHLGDGHERRVCEVHRPVRVLEHQFQATLQCVDTQEPDAQSSDGNELAQVLRTSATGTQQMESLSQNRHGRAERLGQLT